MPPTRSSVSHRGSRVPALVASAVAAAGVLVVWRVFVTTRTGQLVDQAAFDGGAYGRTRLWRVAEPVLDVVSVPFVAVVVLAAMTLAVVRRRPLLAVQVALLVGGANLTTQVLKHVVLTRPDLDVGDRLSNALPSGHATVAASVSAVLLLVVPRRFRPLAAVVAVGYTVATGVSTLVGAWHRPSDVVAAVLVVAAWGGLALATRPTEVAGADHPAGTHAVVVLLGLVAVATGVPAALALRHTYVLVTEAGRVTERADLITAYGGGALAVVAVTCAAVGALLWSMRAAETRGAQLRGAEVTGAGR